MSYPRIWLSAPHMGEKELEFVNEAFATNWVAPLGPHVDAFEVQLKNYVGVAAAGVLNSGTAALHLSLIEVGTRKGDIVICQSLTFAASAFPIKYVGAEPIFIDSEMETWNMDPVLLEKALQDCHEKGQKVAAIIVVHLYGMPAKMNEIMSIAAQYKVPVIEDAAEALGSTYQNAACGSMGNFGVLSFNGNKIITTSGGGAIVSNDANAIQHARFLSTQAKEPFPYYEHEVIGFNYRMSNIAAGIGRGQMMVLEERVKSKRNIHSYYERALAHIPAIQFLAEPIGSFSNRWLTTILVDPNLSAGITNEHIRLKLESFNVESRKLWKPMHLQPVFKEALAYVNGNAELLFDRGLCLPSSSFLSEETLRFVTEIIISVFDESQS